MIEKIMEEIGKLYVDRTGYGYECNLKEYSEVLCGNCCECIKSACKVIIRNHMNDGWIPVEEALPDEEAEEYIKKRLHGIGYLYPCLVTYRSPMTERIHVVRFYYDIYEHWFVDAGEEVCEKERCIAWRPLPEPYKPKQPETCKYTGGSCCWPVDQCGECPNNPERSENDQ